MVQNKRSRLILDATYVTYLGTERINGTVRVLFKTRLIFSRINGPIMCMSFLMTFLLTSRRHLLSFFNVMHSPASLTFTTDDRAIAVCVSFVACKQLNNDCSKTSHSYVTFRKNPNTLKPLRLLAFTVSWKLVCVSQSQ